MISTGSCRSAESVTTASPLDTSYPARMAFTCPKFLDSFTKVTQSPNSIRNFSSSLQDSSLDPSSIKTRSTFTCGILFWATCKTRTHVSLTVSQLLYTGTTMDKLLTAISSLSLLISVMKNYPNLHDEDTRFKRLKWPFTMQSLADGRSLAPIAFPALA